MIYFKIIDQNFTSDTTSLNIDSKSFSIGSNLTSDICLLHKSFDFEDIHLSFDNMEDQFHILNQNQSFPLEKIANGLFYINIENCDVFLTTDSSLIHGLTADEIKSSALPEDNLTPSLNEQEIEQSQSQDELTDSEEDEYELVELSYVETIKSYFADLNQNSIRIFGAFGASFFALILLAVVLIYPAEDEVMASLKCPENTSTTFKVSLLFSNQERFQQPAFDKVSCTQTFVKIGANYFGDKILEEAFFLGQNTISKQIQDNAIEIFGFTSVKFDKLHEKIAYQIVKSNAQFNTVQFEIEDFSQFIDYQTFDQKDLIDGISSQLQDKKIRNVILEILDGNDLMVYVNKRQNADNVNHLVKQYLKDKHIKINYTIKRISLSDFGISSIVQGDNPYFLSKNGQKYFEGSKIGGSITLGKISRDSISFIFNGNTIIYPL